MNQSVAERVKQLISEQKGPIAERSKQFFAKHRKGVLLSVLILLFTLVGHIMGPQHSTDHAGLQRAAKELEQKESDEKLAAAAAASAAAKAEKEKRELAERENEKAMYVTEYRGMTAAKRLSTVSLLCDRNSGCSYPRTDYLIESAANDSEAAQLKRAIAQAEKAYEANRKVKAAADAVATRKSYAAAYDESLLARHLNPDCVSAEGKTLHIQGWFCTRQFMHDFQNGIDATTAKAVGFTKVHCSSGVDNWTADL